MLLSLVPRLELLRGPWEVQSSCRLPVLHFLSRWGPQNITLGVANAPQAASLIPLLYGMETVAVTERMEEEMKAAELKILRCA